MKYKVTVPPTHDVGSYSTIVSTNNSLFRPNCETKAQAALADYNSVRAHDGLDPVKRMPSGTVYTPLYDYILQGHYGDGWEDLTCEETRKEAITQRKCYQENEGGTYRIIRRKSE